MILFPKLSPLSFVLLGVLLIIGGIYKKVQFTWTKSATWFVGLYLFYGTGVLLSSEPEWKELEYKLSWLILPVLLSFTPKKDWSIRMAGWGLIIGVVVATVYGIYSAYSCYAETGWLAYCFNGVFISPIHHPTYFTLFTLFAAVVTWLGVIRGWKGYTNWLSWCMTVLAVVMTYFYFSFAGMLFLLLFIGAILVFWMKRKLGLSKTIGLGIGLIVLVTAVVFVSEKLKKEVQSNLENVSSYLTEPNEFLESRKELDYIPGNEERLILWNLSAQLIADHPFGVGAGKSVDVLKTKLDEIGFKQLVKNELNPHNQYLQTGLELGWLGLLIILSFFFFLIWFAFKNKLIALLILVIGFGFNSLFESMFQRQSGIVFFTFWVSLLIVYHISKKNQLKE